MDGHSLERLDFYRVRELVAGYALTGLGRALTETIRPVTRVDLVRRWMIQVQELSSWVKQRGLPPMGGVSDVRALVQRCAPPLRVGAEEVGAIGLTLAATRDLTVYLRGLPEDAVELRGLAERIGDFSSLAERIFAVLDERGQVRDDASPKLARIRAEIASATAGIRQTVEKLLHDPGLRRLLQYPNHTFHGDRMVLPVKTEYRGRLPGIVHRSSDSGATLYIEPAAAVELNNHISNLRSEEQEEIARLLWTLAHEIYINAEAIGNTLDGLAVLDLLAAKVRFANDFDLTVPEIVDEALLSVRQARHPLLLEMRRRSEQADEPVERIVPIDYRLGDDFDLLIITGPNTGGKTVTLKTIGLLTLMTQAGLPIPAAHGARLGVFKNVLIDIGDEQSMAQSLSTFSAHLHRQMEMLQKAGGRTLILIDELGAGTDPDEGSAIGKAILDELLACNARVVVTTHIGALKNYPLTRPRAENGSVEFDVETLRPTYHLRIGEAGMSNALEIAQKLGMPKKLVRAAREHLSGRTRALHAAMQGTVAAKRDAEAARLQAENARLDADRAVTQAQEARRQLERQQADFNAWVQRVVHLQPGEPVRVRNFDRDGRIVRVRLDIQRAEVDVGAFSVEVPLGDVLPPETPAPPPRAPRPRPPEPPPRPRVKRPVAAQVERDRRPGGSGRPHPRPGPPQPRTRPPIPSLTPEQVAALKPGDPVYAKRFHRVGRVVRVNAGKRLALVNVGMLEVEVPFEALATPDAASGGLVG